MATRVARPKADTPEKIFQEHIVLKREGKVITARADKLKATLKGLFDSLNVYVSDSGSKFYDFASTISDGKVDYKGMELRRSVSSVFVEDEATKILQRKGVYNEALTPVLDQEKIWRLLAEGKITEKDIEKMFTDKESFAFWPVEGEV